MAMPRRLMANVPFARAASSVLAMVAVIFPP